MTFNDAVNKWLVNPQTLRRWIDKKAVPATKVRNAKGHMVWEIPDDAKCPAVKTDTTPSETAERRTLLKVGKHGYVAKYAGTFSIQHMAQFLQTTPAEVRAIYDEIIKNGGF